jgi:hypothetical protein
MHDIIRGIPEPQTIDFILCAKRIVIATLGYKILTEKSKFVGFPECEGNALSIQWKSTLAK